MKIKLLRDVESRIGAVVFTDCTNDVTSADATLIMVAVGGRQHIDVVRYCHEEG